MLINTKTREIPVGLEDEKYYEIIYELINSINKKGLTIRQAQKILIDCADIILDTELYDNYVTTNDSISIIDCLKGIENAIWYLKGIMPPTD